ncbi:MAG: hypothetical protein OET90_10780, partial [Desulfuromonadales bacterium]|nr:hypothetical protein [Desulfuromonadales bacterium]
IDDGKTMTLAEIKQLRLKSENGIKRCKAFFWAAIIIFNLLLWSPLSAGADKIILIAIGAGVLSCAFVPPVMALRRHRQSLDLLQSCAAEPKRKKASTTGKAYIDMVLEQDRPFIKIELLLLEKGD